jgi:A/G-specific adenine glycosylase
MNAFAQAVLDWYDVHGRRSLPWQHPRSPYRVWISEVMLQQTQVATVIPYFERFVARFPNVAALARAEIDDVLHLWTGLGYYARGRNLYAAAQRIVAEFAGDIPDSLEALVSLPGIGRSTAGAILSVAHGIRAPILDGNVKRVLARHFAVAGYPGETSVANELWRHAEATTPDERVADYTQAIMDLGATLCTRAKPRCDACPVASSCAALADDNVDRFPLPRPKKVLPVRRARMFVITDPNGHCLLERRSPTGLWGGLWNPPERSDGYADADLFAELGIRVSDVSDRVRMPVFRHSFTHFHLDIEPLRIELNDRPLVVSDADRWRWFGAGSNESLGLSAVAVRLLALIKPLELT